MARSSNETFVVPHLVALEVTAPVVQEALERSRKWGRQEEVAIPLRDLTDEVLAELIQFGGANRKFLREVTAMKEGRKGNFKSIPRISAAPDIMNSYVRQDAGELDGWIYERTASGGLRAYLVSKIYVRDPMNNDDKPSLVVVGSYNSILGSERQGRSRGVNALRSKAWHWDPAEVTRKTPNAILESRGLMRETPALREEYDQHVEQYRQTLTEGFARQYRYTGTPISMGDNAWRTPNPLSGGRVVHDVHPSEIIPFVETMAVEEGDEEEIWNVPLHFDLRVFDLKAHQYLIVDSRGMGEYVYDKSLREKLVLPEDQRDLLDILTNDISTFTSDLIEGKAAGNVILCKGRPGVGKTLSAEVYAELTERPLYSIHSGSLGITAEDIRKNLEQIFERSQRWDAVLLLDEADVFVIERGDNLEQNAIVAEFLRTMEYFSGLMFMTTNRSDSIDEAIISRCAAIIDYRVPGRNDARKIWHVLATLSETTLEEDLVEALLDGFPTIAPRDIKMLLRLTLRVSRSKGEPLSVDMFRRCAMFRGLHFQGEAV